MTTLRALLQRRAAIQTEMRSLIEAHRGEMPADAAARFDVLRAEADSLNAAEGRLAALADLDARMAGAPADTRGAAPAARECRMFGASVPVPAGFAGRLERAQDGSTVPLLTRADSLASFLPADRREPEVGLGGFLRALYSGPANDAERRAMGEATVGAGGAFVPAPLAAQLIDLYRAAAVSFQAGVVTIPMDAATLRLAQLTADPVGGWRAESAAVAEGTPTFANITLAPKSWALLVRVSRELLMDGQNTSGLLEGVFARVAAVALDQAILYGTGSSNQPLGIANTSGIQTVSSGTNGASLASWGKVLDAVQTLETANAGTVSAMIMAPRSARSINGFVDTLGQPLRTPARLANIPQLVTTSMPITETQGSSNIASSMLLGDFAQVFVGLRHGLQISVLQERYSDTGQIGFICHLRADVLVVRPTAIARVTGLLP